MKISVKIFLVSLFIAVILLGINLFWYYHKYNSIVKSTEQHLLSVASIQKSRLENYIAQEQLMLNLITSRTQLRISLKEYIHTGDSLHAKKVRKILRDALHSIPHYSRIDILNTAQDTILLSTDARLTSLKPQLTLQHYKAASLYIHIDSVTGAMYQVKESNLILNGELIAHIHIYSTMDRIANIVQDYSGLGKTGETTVAQRDEEGNAWFLAKTRFNTPGKTYQMIPATADSIAIIKAFKGASTSPQKSFDYRGKEILAFCNIINETNWGIVVKIDNDEILQPLYKSRIQLIIISLVSLLTIFIYSSYIINSITKPVTVLTQKAQDFIQGTPVESTPMLKRNDEIGILSKTFYKMIDSVTTAQALLTDNIATLNKEIDQKEAIQKELTISEKRFKYLFDNTPFGLALCTMDGQLIQVNKKYADIIGYDCDDVLSLSYWDITPKEYEEDEKYQLKQLNTIKRYGPYEKEYIHKSGKRIPVRLNGMIIHYNKEDYIWSSVEDLSDLKKAEVANAKLEDQLHQAHKMEAIGNLAGGIAHDFNNILSAILGYADLAKQDCDKNSEINDYLKGITNAGTRAKEMIHQILAYSRKTDIKMKPINLREIVSEVLKLLRATIPASIKIEDHITGTDAFILGDITEIHQVILNICTNAIQAMKEQTGILTVSLNADSHIHDNISITIADNGEGIPKEVLPNIFDPYFTTKEVGKGTGMGLAVVSGIVASHHGKISVESTPNTGTTFRITFPKYKGTIPHQIESTAPSYKGTGKILVIDDEKDIIEITERQLTRIGFDVETFTSSLDALDRFNENIEQFDLIITDFTMPDINGEKFASEIRKVNSTIPIIICTGYSTPIHENRLDELSITNLVAKPIDYNDLINKVQQSLNQ